MKIFQNEKSQITLFIIIGILIILAASFLFYFRSLAVIEPETVPEDLMPIKNYVEACLSSVGEEAAVALGVQGGYIEIPDEIRLSRAYIEVMPRSLIRIPYWYYNGLSFVPTINSMQNQISFYVEQNVRNCFSFDVFKNDYDIEEIGNMDVSTIIADEDVDLSMNYELIVKDKATGEPTKISKFHRVIPVRLKKAYELGKKIMEAENSLTFFENITIDWLSMNKNIPLNGIEFHCNELKWKVSDVKNELQDMIYYNLPNVKVKNTAYSPFLEDDKVYEDLKKYTLEDINKGDLPKTKAPEDAYDYSHYLIDARASKTDLKAGFMYNPEWGMDITARPSENGIMRSIKQDASDEFLSFMCLNVYHFNYDVVYPIEVLIRDDKSFNNRGYVFRYAFPVMINHNYPDRSGFLNNEFIMQGGDFTGQCDGLSGAEYNIIAYGLDEFGVQNMELRDVNITYDCFKFKCYLGKTKSDQGSYQLRTKLPSACSHGLITAEKEGYLKTKVQVLDTTDIDVDLKKLKRFNFDVVMNTYNSLNNNIGDDASIKSPFTAVMDIQSFDDPSLSFHRVYPFDENSEKTIDLIEQDSKYKIEIMLFDEADGILIGGYKANWSLSYDDIDDSNKIVFHAASYLPKPMNSDAEQNVYKFLDENNIYKESLKPELVR